VFQDTLEIALNLTIGSDVFALPCGSVKGFELEAKTWGFWASVSFCVSAQLEADALFPRFISDDCMRVSLELRSSVTESGDADADAPSIKLIGYATERSLVEVVADGVAGLPIALRKYTVQFRDAASTFWRQHYPIELHVDTSMSSLFDMHRVEGIALEYGDGPFADKLRMICIPDSRRASFYDFVCWYLTTHNAHLEFDAASSRYRMSQRKGGSGATELEPEDTSRVEVVLGAPRRSALQVLNSFSPAATRQRVEVASAVTGVRRDVLHTTPIPKQFEQRVSRESLPLTASPPGMRLCLARFPRQMFRIGTFVSLGERYSRALQAAGADHRVYELSIRAQAAGDQADPFAGLEDDMARYDLDFVALLEHKRDAALRLPDFAPPEYPCQVEAKVVSFGGQDTDRTWFSIEDEATSLTSYQLEVPLFNKKIEAPFDAAYHSGHFFFPAYKNARVVVALGFDTAEIVRHIDWADNARLPKDSQGNQIAFGYQKNNGTTLRHVYKDNKPELHLERSFGNDLETLELSDGLMRWRVEELANQTALEPKYDVTVQVEAAKGQLATKVNGSVGELGASFAASSGSATAAIEGASAQLADELSGMETTLSGKIESSQTQIRDMTDALTQSVDALASAGEAAKRAILEEAES